MSFFSRSRKPKTSTSRETKFQSSGDDVKNSSGEQTGGSNTGASLFSGMTLTISPASTAGDNLSLMGHTDLMRTKQPSHTGGAAKAITQDFATVLAKSEAELLPEPILPTPVNTAQQTGHSTTKKKRTRHVVRPGYARQPDKKAGDLSKQSPKVSLEKSCDTVEQKKGIKQDAANVQSIRREDSSPAPLTPLYSIGTPSSSDENLFQEDDTHSDTSSAIAISSDATIKDDLTLESGAQGHSEKELKGIMDVSGCENQDIDSETTRLDKYFEVSMTQQSEVIDDRLELQKLPDVLENPPKMSSIMLDDSSTLPSYAAQSIAVEREMANLQAELESLEEVDQNVEQELQQPIRSLISSTDLESTVFDVPETSVYPVDKPSNYSISISSTDKLNITLQHMESQLATLSEDKRSLRILEEVLFKLYTEAESSEYEKEQQVKELQLEESQALANDNYDLAEEINNRIEQVKAELESSRYRLPAQDDKVEKALKLRAEVAEKEAEIYRQSQATLEQVREEQQECLTSHTEMTTSWNARAKQRLNADRQRLERAKDHLRLDKEHMEAENVELSKEILQQTEAFETRKEELIQERGLLQEEISALEAKLAKLKEKEVEFTESIKQEETKIESVKMAFSPQQNALDKQRQEIEAREKSLQKEFELLLSTQKQFDDKTAQHCTKEKEMTKVLSTASDELDKSKKIIKRLEEQQRFVQEFLNMKHFNLDTNSKLERLYVKQKEVSQQIKALSNKMQLEQRGVVTLRKSLNEIEAQISDLDAAKEIAKQERNFKEAKRLKEERETLTQEGVESQGKLESLLKEIAEDKKLLEEAEQESKDLDAEISEKDREAAMVTVEKASILTQALQEQINRIGGDSLIKALLETESKTCKNAVSDLCRKHDIPIPDLDKLQVDTERSAHDISENTEVESEQQKSSKSEGFEEQTEDRTDLLDKLNELEGRLEAVVDVEDFDEADRLQEEITKLKEMIEQRKAGHV